MRSNRIDRVFGFAVFGIRGTLASVLAVLIGVPIAGVVGAATFLFAPLPGTEIPEAQPQIVAMPSVVLDSAGNEIAVYRGFDLTVPVTQSDIGEMVQNAFIAIEDKKFWTHPGVDVEGIARAAKANLEAGGVSQGGSTITQQYVKNVYLSSERSLDRKVEEARLAVELEKMMSKEEILFGYLNVSYFGSGAYGIGAAAEIYFNKRVSELSVSEAAALAAIVKAPAVYGPNDNLDAAEERRKLVLAEMFSEGYISSFEYKTAVGKPLWRLADGDPPSEATTLVHIRKKKGSVDYPYISDWLEEELVELLGEDLVYRGGLKVETTIDSRLQEDATEAVGRRLKNTSYPVDMALVSLDPETGFVKAMVAGRDYSNSQVNLATGGSTGFQPGSSFKPIVLATAFEQGMNPSTVYRAPGSWSPPGCRGRKNCTISNYSNSGYGSLNLRGAMEKSVNTVFGQLILDTSIAETVAVGRDLGISRLDSNGQYGASLSLGAAETSPLEMAAAYGTFANRGLYQQPTAILRVIDPDGNVLIDNRVRAGKRVLHQATADNVTDVLTGVITAGTGKAASIGRPAAGKTGTAQAYRAAWFVGYTPQLATAVWMGHVEGLKSLRNVNGVGAVTGGSHPARAWADFMKVAHLGLETEEFPDPDPIDKSLAKRARAKKSDSQPIGANEETVVRTREFTSAGIRGKASSFEANCGGDPCVDNGIQLPWVPPATPPTTAAVEVGGIGIGNDSSIKGAKNADK